MSNYDNGYELSVERAWDEYCGEASEYMTLKEVIEEVKGAKSVREVIARYEEYSEYMENAPDLKVEVWGENDTIETSYSWQYDGNHTGCVVEWYEEGNDIIISFMAD